MTHAISDELRYRLLTYLNEHPEASQREVAQHLGVSVGKVNYCLRALIEIGLLKVRNFRKSKRKQAYAYVLTPIGIEEKVNVTMRFLRRKIEEYDALSQEIERLTRELAATEAGDSAEGVAS
jgi:EPS-associated MarR family transcriptional regulator